MPKKYKNKNKFEIQKAEKNCRDSDVRKTFTKFGEYRIIFRYRKIEVTKALQTYIQTFLMAVLKYWDVKKAIQIFSLIKEKTDGKHYSILIHPKRA